MIFPTGIKALDNCLYGGLRPSSLVVIGGRPSMGKTALMYTIATNLLREKIKFYFLSLECKAEHVLNKILHQSAGVRINNSIEDKITNLEYQSLAYAATLMKNCDSLISDERDYQKILKNLDSLDPSIKIVFIDYLQILSDISCYEEASNAVTQLKKISQDKDICIVVACQLTRGVEIRPGHRPQITDLRDSGAIEECADQIIMILRRDYYDLKDKPGKGELMLIKNRFFGTTKNINVNFNKEIMAFSDFTPEYYPALNEDEAAFSAFSPLEN